MKYTVYFSDEIEPIVENININFQSRESAMKSFSQKYPTKIVTNVVKDYNDFPVNTKLTDLSQIETYLIEYLINQYKEFYNSNIITNAKVTDFKDEFIKKLKLDYFSDLNKYISYPLFEEYSKS
jgi:hypothetical protein